MTLESTLKDLAERRLSFRAFRDGVEAELRALRADRLAVEQSAVEHLVLRAAAEGATIGQIKKAYGTKDHRTIASIVHGRSAEIEAIRSARAQEEAVREWFFINGKAVTVEHEGSKALFTWAEVDGELMFITDTPQWDESFTVRNEAVILLDGKTESQSIFASAIAVAIREQAGG